MKRTTSSFNLQSAVSPGRKIPLGERGETEVVLARHANSRPTSRLVETISPKFVGSSAGVPVMRPAAGSSGFMHSRTVLLSLTLETDDGLFSGQRTLRSVQRPSRSSYQFVG